MPAFNKLEPSYPGHSAYRRYTHDSLHTLLGLLEFWAQMVITIVDKIAKIDVRYTHAIANLEEMIIRFPEKHSMPFRVKRFRKGLSSIFPGLDGNANNTSKTTGYGQAIGMIDNKDVPSLVLQIILCKRYYTFRMLYICF